MKDKVAKSSFLVAGIGELLWDLLPAGAELGGAVSNTAVMAGRLGDRAICASRLGEDELGRQARARLTELPIDPSYLQTDSLHATGAVDVALKAGQPMYEIRYPAAWDFLELSPAWLDLAGAADAVCFGTLAQRSPVSRSTIQGFLAATRPECVRLFDVNLRAPFYTSEAVEEPLLRATVLKMNDAELPEILGLLGLSGCGDPGAATEPEALLAGARQLLDAFPLELVCITMGSRGSLLVSRAETHRHPGLPTTVVDSVGAGDAFTAALLHHFLRRAPLAAINEAGNRCGAWVASHRGAMPALDASALRAVTQGATTPEGS